MLFVRSTLGLLGLLTLTASCKAPAANAAEPAPEAAEPAHPAEGGAHARAAAAMSKKFGVPFAVDVDREEPLAQTRSYFQALFADNSAYMRTHDGAFFKAFATSQKPRATIVTCSDSRVQSPAFDATPENDDFFIRNIGNQISTSEGSVEYGVHHLKTPVLLILGHTGCGAVKGAMGDFSKESAAIRRELEPMKVPKRKEGTKDDDPAQWLDGVVANVHEQVAFALATFGEEVAEGRLTVVGAVYDLRNDLKQGSGRVLLVDVNGHRDAAKVQAFERGVLGLVGPDPRATDAGARTREAKDAAH